MTRSFRIQSFLAGLCLTAGVLALPLSAEEITVTVPPDQPPAAASKPAAPLPSFTGSGLAQSDTSATAQDGAAPAATTAKHKAKDKKPAAAAKASPGTSDTTTSSTTPTDATGAASGDAAAKPKTASKASPCKDADEATCGSNKLCKWVEGTTDSAGKATKSRCRSLAALKKEAAKKTAKAGEGDALPWAAKTDSPTGASDGAAASSTSGAEGTAKPAKKTKTASAKKPAKPKAETPAAQPADQPAGDASGGQPPEAPSNANPQ